MPLNFVFLCPNFPENHRFYCTNLNRLGANVFGIGDELYENLHEDLKASLKEYKRVDSMEDYDQVYRAVAYLISRYGRIDRIESNTEYWLETEAKLRTDFNLPAEAGYSAKEIYDLQRKSFMKECFRQAGIPVARGRLCTTYEDALEFARQTQFPLVFKPDRGVGASNTWKIHNEWELGELFRQHWRTIGNHKYIMEEYIEGDIVTFDGLTNQQGDIVFYASTQYSIGVMDIINHDKHIYYYVRRWIEPDLYDAGVKSVKAFNIRGRFFHIEFFRTRGDNRVVALEANLRAPGGFTVDMFNFAHSIDLYYEYANMIVRNRFDSRFLNQDNGAEHYCVYASRKYHHQYQHSHDAIKARYGDKVVMAREMPVVFRKAMGDFFYCIILKDAHEVHEAARFIQLTNFSRDSS
eukprot:GEZU01032518.1.p1 GENE.GEZU01032518.1~~GEZU01032518.1.p1  ORF type:complete len:408 (+),score=139.15 GEZU01032518.1:237-1460(+)